MEAALFPHVRRQHFFISLVIKNKPERDVVHIVFGVSQWMGRPRKRLKRKKNNFDKVKEKQFMEAKME